MFMEKEMRNEFIKDVQNGKIFGLKLIKTDNDIIRNNVFGEMFEVVRELYYVDDKMFYLKTRLCEPHYFKGTCNEKYESIEGYFSAFQFYDGKILRSINEYPATVDEIDKVSITEYEVIRSY